MHAPSTSLLQVSREDKTLNFIDIFKVTTGIPAVSHWKAHMSEFTLSECQEAQLSCFKNTTIEPEFPKSPNSKAISEIQQDKQGEKYESKTVSAG